MKQTKFAKTLALCVGVLVFSVSASYLIFAWTAPSTTPPGGNVAAPINTGSTAQGKMGSLGIGTTTPRAKLDVNGSVYLTGGNVSNIPSTIGFQSSDAALLVPTYTGSEDSDLRLYLEDNANERFSIWGDSCSGGGCMNLNNSSLAHSFEAGGNAYHKGNVGIGTANPSKKLDVAGYVKGQEGLCVGDECCSDWDECVALGDGDDGDDEGSFNESSCNEGGWVTGIDSAGKVVCDYGNNPAMPDKCTQVLTGNNKRIFVTSASYVGNELGNNKPMKDMTQSDIALIDARCQTLASQAGLAPDGEKYKALIFVRRSNNESALREPFHVLKNNYYYWTGEASGNGCAWHLVADGETDFFTQSDGTYLKSPIKYTQTGAVGPSIVYTTFMPTGGGSYIISYKYPYDNTLTYARKGFCTYHYSTVGSHGDYNYYGLSNATGIEWAYNPRSSQDTCHLFTGALYCVQQ